MNGITNGLSGGSRESTSVAIGILWIGVAPLWEVALQSRLTILKDSKRGGLGVPEARKESLVLSVFVFVFVDNSIHVAMSRRPFAERCIDMATIKRARVVIPVSVFIFVFLLVTWQKAKLIREPARQSSELAITEPQALAALQSIGERIHAVKGSQCKVQMYGNGWGGHNLCELHTRDANTCTFWSFGVSTDYSFDTDLSLAGCSGFSFDPSVVLQSQLAEGVIFMQLAANMLTDREKQSDYTYLSLPKLMQAFHMSHLDILKLDCEGCEYALASDILKSGKNIFDKMQQLTIELHLSDAFLHTRNHVIELGKLFHLLAVSKMNLVAVDLQGLDTMETGCTQLQGTGYPCEKGLCAHNLLFAKAAAAA